MNAPETKQRVFDPMDYLRDLYDEIEPIYSYRARTPEEHAEWAVQWAREAHRTSWRISSCSGPARSRDCRNGRVRRLRARASHFQLSSENEYFCLSTHAQRA